MGRVVAFPIRSLPLALPSAASALCFLFMSFAACNFATKNGTIAPGLVSVRWMWWLLHLETCAECRDRMVGGQHVFCSDGVALRRAAHADARR